MPARNSILYYLEKRPLRSHPWSDELLQRVIGSVKDPKPEVRIAAAKALVDREVPGTKRAIEGMLADEQKSIRKLAMGTISRWPDRDRVFRDYANTNGGSAAWAGSVKYFESVIKQAETPKK